MGDDEPDLRMIDGHLVHKQGMCKLHLGQVRERIAGVENEGDLVAGCQLVVGAITGAIRTVMEVAEISLECLDLPLVENALDAVEVPLKGLRRIGDPDRVKAGDFGREFEAAKGLATPW